MLKRVAITGMGLISSLGQSPASLHSALCDGGTEAASPGGPISSFEPQVHLQGRPLRTLDRTGRLVSAAAKLALENSGWQGEKLREHEVGLVVGTMFGSVHTISVFDRHALEQGPAYASPMDFANTVINAAAGQTAIWHNLRGINSTIASGTSSGLMALGYAGDLIRVGAQRAVLAGGADEFCFESFCGFEGAAMSHESGNGEKCPVPFDARRTGFVVGEGAGLLMLEEWECASARGAVILAEILGHGNAFDPERAEPDCAAEIVARAMRIALDEAFLTPPEIDCISASANGSIGADRNEALAIKSLLNGAYRDIPVTAVKSMTGEVLGAFGGLQAIAMVETIRTRVLPPIQGLQQIAGDLPELDFCREQRSLRVRHGLINSIGLDGNACALIISQGQG